MQDSSQQSWVAKSKRRSVVRTVKRSAHTTIGRRPSTLWATVSLLVIGKFLLSSPIPGRGRRRIAAQGHLKLKLHFVRDKKETLAQNYRRLGLTARLKAPTGGTEIQRGGEGTGSNAAALRSRRSDPLAIASTEQAVLSEAKVERDADGKIIRIISRTASTPNAQSLAGRHGHKALNDPLNALESDSEAEDADEQEHEEWGGIKEDGTETEVVKSLIAEASAPVVKKPRHQSEREVEWLTSLTEKHGDDYQAMARDHRLNPMQQTAADIKRRIRKMNA